MKMRATRGSFTWQGRLVTAGQSIDVAGIPDATLAAMKRLYGLEEAKSARGRRIRLPDPEPDPAVDSDPVEEVYTNGSSEA